MIVFSVNLADSTVKSIRESDAKCSRGKSWKKINFHHMTHIHYSMILMDDALLEFELWLLKDMCWFSSLISSFGFGISVAVAANVQRLFCFITRFRRGRWWVWKQLWWVCRIFIQFLVLVVRTWVPSQTLQFCWARIKKWKRNGNLIFKGKFQIKRFWWFKVIFFFLF